jgi:hypothetical protein|tara:strand:- start:1956 stop:2336 length:381 start_codon:yes stop_codon:yes gene_type:complete
MGLDQTAYVTNYDPESGEKEILREFSWRKHAKLQQYMLDLYSADHPNSTWEDFNSGEKLHLTRENIVNLKKLVEESRLPFCPAGFFWGHQFQEESQKDYEEQDLEFCNIALEMLDKGHDVIYECWW